MLSERSRRLAPSLAVIAVLAGCGGNETAERRGADSATTGAGETQHQGTASARAGRIVFDAGDANWDIYVVDTDGSGLKRLTASPAREFDPSWSPDGSKIAYRHEPEGGGEAEAEIYVMNSDGTATQNLTRSPGQDHSPAWSPDGTQIAFASTRGQENLLPSIWVMDADGSNPTRVSPISGEYPAWSRDGARIAFDVNTDIETDIEGRPANFDIFVVNADGSGLLRLTNAPGADHGASWSPDGKKIVFHSDRGRSDGLTTLWLMNWDGSEQRPLTDQAGFRPTWSRDGSRILFSASGLFTVRPDGSGLTKLPVRVPGELGFADWTE